MLHCAVLFFVTALAAAMLGFTGIAASAAGLAQALFILFLVLAIGALVANVSRRSF